ncbi:hypothetical protein KC19_6G068000 [Ceratodon purpureus]|uniref:Non-specific serine/threonine protein kinase n=1 Tax=Ceratodon purpureus TaxID=3225 RepID=A0A8T0HCD4_CERPU|nr:hypothetical protein KC19_6G068000 [Ceratodon purpureus]
MREDYVWAFHFMWDLNWMDSGKVLLTLFLLLRLLPVWTSPSPTLGLSSRLNVNDTLVSPWGHFELGIFAFGPSQGPKYQLCIRYAAPIEQVVTWVANRDVPLSNKAYLELSAVDRNLQLFDPANGLNKPLWISSNTERVAITAQLLDMGNLVLMDSNGTITWDSFKNSSTTDTLLPGQYLYKNDTKRNTLTSWLTKDNPATGKNGTYTFGWGTLASVSGPILQLAWSSPQPFSNWTGGTYIPAPDVKNPHAFLNVDSVYFDTTYGNLSFPSFPANTVILSGGDVLSNMTLKRLTLDRDGGLRIWQWTVGTSKKWVAEANWVVNEQGSQCFAFGTCGSFGFCQMTPPNSLDRANCTCLEGFYPIDGTDLSRGCAPEVAFNGSNYCGSNNSSPFDMTELNGVDVHWGVDYNTYSVETRPSSCSEVCLKDCKCTGAVYSKAEGRCWRGAGTLYNLGYPNPNRTSYIKFPIFRGLMEPPSLPPTTSVMLFVILLLVVFLLVVVGICYCMYKSRQLREWVVSFLSKCDDGEGSSGNESDPPLQVGSQRMRATEVREPASVCVLADTDFLKGDYVKPLTAALDVCNMQVQEFEKLLPSVSIFEHLCNYSVETLSSVAQKNFEQYRGVLSKPRVLEGDHVIPSNLWSSVSFCFESLAGLAQSFQLVDDLLRKCSSTEWYKSALELADVRPCKDMKRWSQFSFAIQNCEWSLDVVELAFHALEKLLTEGEYIMNDASFKWVEEKDRMVLEIQGKVAAGGGPVLLEDCGVLEEKDLEALIKKLQKLEESEKGKKWFYQGPSSAHEIASYLGKKLSGPAPEIGTYLPYSFTEINPASLRCVKHLDKGSAGTVDKNKWNIIEVAVKTVNGVDRAKFEQEAAILGMVQHPNVVRLIGCGFIEESKTGLLVMELMNLDLRKLIDSRLEEASISPFSPIVAIDIMLQIAQAMVYVRKHNVLHRDLKAKNILINLCNLPMHYSLIESHSMKLPHVQEHFVAKLADLGLAKWQPQSSDVFTLDLGTTRWRAPEVFKLSDTDLDQSYKWPADVYSYAMMCYEVLTGKIPFQDEPSLNGLYNKIMAGKRPSFDDLNMVFPEGLMDLIKICWATEPSDRPTFDDVVKKLWECKVQSVLPRFLQTQNNS